MGSMSKNRCMADERLFSRGKACRYGQKARTGQRAAGAGFKEGDPWLYERLTNLKGIYDLLKQRLTQALTDVHIDPLESTYMVWVNLVAYLAQEELVPVVQVRARLAVDFGFWFWPKEGVPADDCRIRINIPASRANIMLAADRLIQAKGQAEHWGRGRIGRTM